MISFASFWLPKKKKRELSPGNVAKDRLEFLLLSERMQSSPEMMEQMKKELQDVIRKYLNTDHVQMNIQIDLTNDVEQGVKHVKTIQIKRL